MIRNYVSILMATILLFSCSKKSEPLPNKVIEQPKFDFEVIDATDRTVKAGTNAYVIFNVAFLSESREDIAFTVKGIPDTFIVMGPSFFRLINDSARIDMAVGVPPTTKNSTHPLVLTGVSEESGVTKSYKLNLIVKQAER